MRVNALFSPEILQAGAVKGLKAVHTLKRKDMKKKKKIILFRQNLLITFD